MKVFVTGHKGYIGSHLVDILKHEGHQVTGCDIGYFDGCTFGDLIPTDKDLKKDVRSLNVKDFEGHDCVMHLAAISNDPMNELDPSFTYDVNRDGSINLARLAKKAGVPRFLFAGSCSVYKKGEKQELDENSAFSTATAYAVSKVEAELGIKEMADENFSPVVLRLATAYGYSPMLRIDLVVNNLLACAVTRGDIRIMSDGSSWRPLIHCRDMARAFVEFAFAPKEIIHNLSVNIGANSENYRIKEIVGIVKQLAPHTSIELNGEPGTGAGNYRVNFNLLHSLFPEFKLEYNLAEGMEELFRYFREKKFTLADFEGDKYIRLRTLKKLL